MKNLRKDLDVIKGFERRKHHPFIHKVHKKYGISKKTLFYIKEYGPHANVPHTIIKESLKILLLASIISSFGGLALEYVKTIFVSIMPLVILLPALNDMIGDYGTIVSAKVSAILHEGKIKGRLFNAQLRKLFAKIFVIALVTSAISAFIALVAAYFSGYSSTFSIASKIFFISLLDTSILVSLLFMISVFAGIYFYRKNEDPNNFLIPITTSIADFGNILLLSILIAILF